MNPEDIESPKPPAPPITDAAQDVAEKSDYVKRFLRWLRRLLVGSAATAAALVPAAAQYAASKPPPAIERTAPVPLADAEPVETAGTAVQGESLAFASED